MYNTNEHDCFKYQTSTNTLSIGKTYFLKVNVLSKQKLDKNTILNWDQELLKGSEYFLFWSKNCNYIMS